MKSSKRNIILKTLPYTAALISGLIFFAIGNEFKTTLRSLFHNISAAFFAVPLLFLFYELAKSFSNRKLNKEIYDYIKLQVDTEVLSITNKIFKIVYGYDYTGLSNADICVFLTIDKSTLTSLLENKTLLGFQILKDWEQNELALQKLLENTFITGRIDNEYVISIIQMIKNLRGIELLQYNFDIFEKLAEKKEGYQIFGGIEVDPKQIKYDVTYLLLKKLDGVKDVVIDSSSFAKCYVEKLLTCYTLKKDFVKDYVQGIYDIMEDISNWLTISGNEFLIDTKQFRIVRKNRR